MSQKRTIVPGMDGATPSLNEEPSNLYLRETNNAPVANGTVVPGMNQFAQGGQTAQRRSQYASSKYNGKPITGFLYSISRLGVGEYWPLHMGANVIGSSPKSDVYLKEGTVSTEHAVIVVRKMKNPEKIVASITDSRSTNGTMINGISLGFGAQECFNSDVIAVGENYELVLILIDVCALGLKIAEGFLSIEEQSLGPDSFAKDIIPEPSPDQASSKFDYNDNFNPYSPNSRPTDGTVNMDGSKSAVSGGTVPM